MDDKERELFKRKSLQNLDTASPKDLKRAIKKLKRIIKENDKRIIEESERKLGKFIA